MPDLYSEFMIEHALYISENSKGNCASWVFEDANHTQLCPNRVRLPTALGTIIEDEFLLATLI
jgi:hypothetical protein